MRNCETMNETLRQKIRHYCFFFCKCKKKEKTEERSAKRAREKSTSATVYDWWKIDVNCCDRSIVRLLANVFGTYGGRGARLFVKEIKEILFRANRRAQTRNWTIANWIVTRSMFLFSFLSVELTIIVISRNNRTLRFAFYFA